MSKPKVVTAYKAFGPDWKCRDFQFEVGKTYEMSGPIVPCERGFHACTIPHDVFRYYDMATSKVARVSVVDPISHGGDSKVASAKITIEAELTMPEWITATVDAIFALCGKPKKTAEHVEAASGNDSSLAASGNDSRAKVGPNGAIVLAYWDGARPRFAVGYVGENGINADTWYRVENGKLTECAE